jgi:hypothetical protein
LVDFLGLLGQSFSLLHFLVDVFCCGAPVHLSQVVDSSIITDTSKFI